MGVWRAIQKRCRWVDEKPFRYELQLRKDVSNAGTLTNHCTLRHLQNRISDLAEGAHFLRFRDIVKSEIGVKGYAESAQIVSFSIYYHFISIGY